MSLIVGFYCCRMAAVTVYPWPSGVCGRIQPQRSHFDFPWKVEHASVNSSDIVNFLLNTNDGRGRRPN